MIASYLTRYLEDCLANRPASPLTQPLYRAVRRKLLILQAAVTLNDVGVPPGNRLEKLKGDRAGQFSIRVNDQWRLCFRWVDGKVADLELVDYHP